MKTSTQLKALIRNLSKSNKVEAEVILRSFMMERFLERISISEYKNNFILKGGVLIAALVGVAARTTMDLDATIKGRELNEPQVVAMVKDILQVPLDDTVQFAFCGVEEIREEAHYPGFRISIKASFGKTRQILHVDITSGDFVTPQEIEFSYQLMFEDRTISIMAYNLETVLAEKFESIITRGAANTRMRDYYDIYLLTTTQRVDKATFRAALENTSSRRQTLRQIQDTDAVLEQISDNRYLMDLWSRYQGTYHYAFNVTWEMVISSLRNLIS